MRTVVLTTLTCFSEPAPQLVDSSLWSIEFVEYVDGLSAVCVMRRGVGLTRLTCGVQLHLLVSGEGSSQAS